MSWVLDAQGLGKRYGRRWALRDCDLQIPSGHVVGLVGPNGAGKTDAAAPGRRPARPERRHDRRCSDRPPAADPAQLARVGFVAQDTPTYARLSVADHLRFGAQMNPGWDAALARQRIADLDLDPEQTAGSLSGGQRAQLALTLAVAKRPELLILDEPVASLDPLARREFLQSLMEFVADGESASCSRRTWSPTWSGCATTSSCSSIRGCRWPARSTTCWPSTAGSSGRGATRHRCRPGRRSLRRATPTARARCSCAATARSSTRPGRSRSSSLEDLVLAYMGHAGSGAGGAGPARHEDWRSLS